MQQWTGTILYLGVFFAIIYFLMIRPQQKQQKQRQQMLGSVKVNDRIVTIGGIHGRVLKMKDDILTIRLLRQKLKLKKCRWPYCRKRRIKKLDQVLVKDFLRRILVKLQKFPIKDRNRKRN